LKTDFINHPELAEKPENAFRLAGWYWQNRNLNRFFLKKKIKFKKNK
jgi:predicted chitinase